MLRIHFTFILLFFGLLVNAQTILNLDFEKVSEKKPIGWTLFGGGNYKTIVDSTNVKSGKYSAILEYIDGDKDFKAWSMALPANYKGKKITLSGYIKTENVTDGYAGLWMRIDPSIAFDNMYRRGIIGTTDWTKYEITLTMNPKLTKLIVIGALLTGKGKMWIDDFHVTIDGIDIKDAKVVSQQNLFAADMDTGFNKGSGIDSLQLISTSTANLKLLGLVWGFLKYHHPSIAMGNYNWDFELFRFLPQYIKVNNNTERDFLLTTWINGLGKLKKGSKLKTKVSTLKIAPDLDWIDSSGLSTDLVKLLKDVRDAKRPKESYYIGMKPNIDNPIFKNEASYAWMLYPDVGYRLLALYRYWNQIQYFFPYKNLIPGDWKNALNEFIPKLIEANNQEKYTLSMLELIAKIKDTHANIYGYNVALQKYFGDNMAPFELKFIENKPVVTAFYNEAFGKLTGLQIGDALLSINNLSIDDLLKQKLPYMPASNYATQLRNVAPYLTRTNDSALSISYLRGENTFNTVIKTYPTKEINKYRIHPPMENSFRMLDSNIAYINHATIKRKELQQLFKTIANTKALIIDDRNYPSDFALYELSSYLVERSTPFTKITTGNIAHPGLFTFTSTLRVGDRFKYKNYYKGKVIILVNELTQSSAEFHAMAYQMAPKAIVMGSTTAGADGNVSQIIIPGGIGSIISGIGIYYPDGRETQGVGIVPDIECKPTIKSIIETRDEVLEKAVLEVKK